MFSDAAYDEDSDDEFDDMASALGVIEDLYDSYSDEDTQEASQKQTAIIEKQEEAAL